MKKSVFLGKGLTILFIVTMMLGVMLSAGRMEVSAAENDTNGNTIERSTPAGDGTEDNPYQIGTKEELYWFAALVNNGDNGACAVLTADITVNTGVLGENGELAKNGDELISWTPISKIQYSYSGIFDGQNHTISGLYFNNPKEEEQDAGLFRRLKASGKIINVGIVDSYFNGENYVGGVCGFNNGTIKNCYYSGTVNGSYCVGGICGENEKSIENCYHIGTVSGTSYVGSICGYNKADVKNCYYDNSTGVEKAIGEDTGTAKDVSGKSTKDMHSSDFCKLITYHSCRNITCSLCGGYQEATCNTDGTYEIGNASQLYWFADKVNNENGTYGNANAVLTKDIVVNQNVLKSDGTLNGDGISFKSWTPIGTVSYSTISQGLLENVHLYNGTFDGRNHTISGLYFNNTSTSYIGLFGYVGTSGKISNVGIIDSYFNGKYYVGSICGYNSGGTMEDCYNTANVSGSNYIGGICGYKSGGTIKTCYHTANVSSLQDNSSNVGGICGYNAKGEIISCYYDSTTYSGEKVGTNKGTLACVDGKTAEQFKSGEVTYLLQGNPGEETEVVWGQTLTGDDQQDFPVLSGKPVYQIYQYAVCEYAANQEEPTKTLYSNSNQDIYEPHKDDGSVSGSVAYDNKCDYCGEPCHSFNENGICEEEGCGYYQGIITNATYSTTVAYCGDATDAQPKTDDFTVASGTKPEFTWYKGDVTTGDLPTVENALGKDAPKELGIYTLVVNAAGAQKDGTVYTAAELRVKVTITKAQLEGSVTIDGTLRCNETVTVNTTDITNEKPGDFVYQWYRVNGQTETIIIDATGASYTLTQEDIGKKIKVVVTSEYCNGTLEATTEATTEATIKKIAAPMEGEGTAEEPYQLGTKEDLYWFAGLVNGTLPSGEQNQSAHAVLTKDIVVNTGVFDANGDLVDTGNFIKWTPIGMNLGKSFRGTFDGQNHTISGVYYESSNEDYGGGLFGKVEGNVRNIGILDSYFNGSANYLGGICGKNEGIIENCYNTGTVSGAGPVGGICGKNEGTIENCYNTGTVSGEMYYIGGICGDSSLRTIKNCYNTGAVSGSSEVGGVCGTSDQDTIANCYNIGKVKGSSEVGGVCGYSRLDTITNCYYNNEVYAGTAIGVDNNGTATKVGGKTTGEFKSGEVAWLLQDGQEDQTELVWGQTLTGDSTQEFPVLKGEKVYKVNKYAVCEDAKVIGEPTEEYSNSNKDIYGPHKDDGSGNLNKAYDNKCDFCGKLYHTFNDDGICEEDNYHQGVITNTSYNTTVAYYGEDTDTQPKPGDFTVASGTVPEFTWYDGDVGTDDLSTKSELAEPPINEGTYTLVVNAAGAENNGVVYTATELRVLVTIAKAPLAGTVTLEGTLKCNETVTVNKDDITHPHPGDLSYKWYRVDGENESVIDGATEPSYTLTTKDIGKKIRVEVYAENCTECLSATTETTVNKLDGSAEIKSTSEELSKYWDETTILTPTFRTGNNEGANNENVTFEYKKITDTDYTMTAPTDAGTYHVRVKVKADSIHSEAVSEPVEFTIAKVNSEVEVAPVAAKNLIYTQGKTVTLIDASNASVTGGQLQYALGENGTYSTALPTVTAAGTYSVYYKVVGDRNHNDTEPVKINVTVRKAVPSYQVPTDISATCRAMLSAVQLPTGFGWTDEDVTLEAGDTATGIQIIKKAKYVPKDTKNYEEVTDIAITIQVTHDSELKGVVEPTCTEKGYSGDSYCKHCRKKIQSGTDVDALDHEFSKDFTVDTEATCKSVGSKSRHCSRCEEKTEITEIPKSDHAWDDGKITKEATETAEGVKTYSCKVCGVTRTETIPKKDAVATQQPTEGSTVSQSPKNGDTITDNKSNAKYTVTDTVKMNVTYSAPITIKAKTITIPATIKINGEIYKVTRIDKNAFKGNKKVTKIVVGSNIQSIGNYAFSGCKKLKTIIIRSKKLTTKTVSKKAFKGIAKKVVVKVPKKKRTAYKKLLKKKGLSSKNRIKNY